MFRVSNIDPGSSANIKYKVIDAFIELEFFLFQYAFYYIKIWKGTRNGNIDILANVETNFFPYLTASNVFLPTKNLFSKWGIKKVFKSSVNLLLRVREIC